MPILQIIINLPLLILGFCVKTLFFAKKGMGKEYTVGLLNGFKLSNSTNGRLHRQKFSVNHIGRYIYIQFMLWINMFRLFA
jgi:hypothetical protein